MSQRFWEKLGKMVLSGQITIHDYQKQDEHDKRQNRKKNLDNSSDVFTLYFVLKSQS